MEMIIGGAFQGKSTYAEKYYPEIRWSLGSSVSEDELYRAEGILGFHEFIRREMRAGKDVKGLAGKLIEKNPDVILVSDEVGYGVVPVDPFDRAYRETVGRICTELASFSTRVTRVVCGIGTVIKNA